MKADWCGFGVREAAREAEEAMQQARTPEGSYGDAALAAARQTAGAELMNEALQQIRRRWAAALIQRGDLRSRSVADLLLMGLGGDDDAKARARLHSRARTSSDPMVTALALQSPCAPGVCANVEASQWSRLEPANLHAWLKLLEGSSASAQPQPQQSTVLDLVVAQAHDAHSYQREVAEILLSLPSADSPGLAAEAEVELLGSIFWAWPMPAFRAVVGACREGLADAVVRGRCEALAELLWAQDDVLHRSMGIALARRLVEAQPGLRGAWEPRARALEAVQAWQQGALDRTMKRLLPAGDDTVPNCEVQSTALAMLRQQVGTREWARLHVEMTEAKADVDALSDAWRHAAGRSLLDPVPARSPASSAGR